MGVDVASGLGIFSAYTEYALVMKVKNDLESGLFNWHQDVEVVRINARL